MVILFEIINLVTIVLRSYYGFVYGFFVSKMLNKLIVFKFLHASMTKFFNQSNIGKILTKLNSDLEIVDRLLP